MLKRNVDLAMQYPQASMELYTNWSSDGFGVVLLQQGRPLYIGSGTHKHMLTGRVVSSFLSEAKCIVTTLKQVAWMCIGRRIKVFTDSENSQRRLTHMQVHREVDMRILRLFSYLLGNFAVGTLLTFHHILGKMNVVADSLSRWKRMKHAHPVEYVQCEDA